MWWSGSVVAMQNVWSVVRIPLELSLFLFFFPQKFSKLSSHRFMSLRGKGSTLGA